MNKYPLLIASALVVLAGIAGCGSDSSETADGSEGPPLTTAQFLRKGNELCANAVDEESNTFEEYVRKEQKRGNKIAPSEFQEFAVESILPIAQRMIDELAALSPPEAKQAEVDKVIADFEDSMDVAQETPARFLSGKAFLAANASADKAGLTACGV